MTREETEMVRRLVEDAHAGQDQSATAGVLVIELEAAEDGRLLISADDWARVVRANNDMRVSRDRCAAAASRWILQAQAECGRARRWRYAAWAGAGLVIAGGFVHLLACGGL